MLRERVHMNSFTALARAESCCHALQAYWWHEQYRPRRPKYFNRVHTGYEWNKYNQSHYDHDNPPPKVRRGQHSTCGMSRAPLPNPETARSVNAAGKLQR